MTETRIGLCTPYAEQLASLEAWFARRGRVAVAFSGGTDSTLLLEVAHRALGADAVAFTARILAQPESDFAFTHEFCARKGVEQVSFELGELELPGFVQNPPERCYLCKREIYRQICALAARRDIACVVDGTNVDDLSADRPGRRALQEAGIETPFVDCGLTKADVRALSRELGLPTWDKPANSCYYTRLAFGETITSEALALVEETERAMEPLGLARVRARLREGYLTREIEV